MVASFVAPVVWGFSNLIDSVAISRKSKTTSSYVLLISVVEFGIATTLFTASRSWIELSHASWLSIFLPILSGFFLAMAAVFYFFLLETTDISKIMSVDPLSKCFF